MSDSLGPHGLPGLPVPHHLQEFAQVHVHCTGDAVQTSHPLTPSSPSALNLSQHQGFSKESSVCIRWPKYWSFSFSISPSSEYQGWSPLSLTGLIYYSSPFLKANDLLRTLLEKEGASCAFRHPRLAVEETGMLTAQECPLWMLWCFHLSTWVQTHPSLWDGPWVHFWGPQSRICRLQNLAQCLAYHRCLIKVCQINNLVPIRWY